MLKKQLKALCPSYALEYYSDLKLAIRQQRNLSLAPDEYPSYLAMWFKEATGEKLDLENPVTFNQKIQWMKLNDSTPEKGYLADKYLVREFVSEQIGQQYLVPLLGGFGTIRMIGG